LRPSIETSLHAIFTQRVVLHVHCIHTLAHAVLANGIDHLREKLKGLDWVQVPYARPGAELAKTVADVLTTDTTIVVLANHGLLVAGDSVADALAQVRDVHRRLAVEAGPSHEPDLERLDRLAAGSVYCLPDYLPAHQLAMEPARVDQAAAGSLYPDHVIFCGIAVHVLADGDTITDLERRCADKNQIAPVFLLVPGAGVLVRQDASSGAVALIRCLADVLLRVPGDAPLSYLSAAQNAELLNWDAEKYRQSLNV
jgi:rhamnose utilization protein RhaD (predicted bifunctional aldolase and dehydrogenase)